MLVLSGKEVALHLEAQIKNRAEIYKKKSGRAPGLAVIMVGDHPASRIYVRNKEAACERVGIVSTRFDVDKKSNVEELESLINRLNADQEVHGILVQSPVPSPFSFDQILAQMNPAKDADGLTSSNLGLLWAGQPRVKPCTPAGVIELLKYYKIPIAGKRAVVVGRSNIVGKPMAQLLMDENATVTICHSKTIDMRSYTREADLVVVAAGQPRLLGKEDFKKGAVVIDVGIHRDANNKVCGDVRFEELEGHVSAATPVPGGVGPMTINMLLMNTLKLAESSLK
jgi:methylenetetrahydrofolate dehydrogenase (NADP+)/methenyltetrahydrofolate cyclohydrolase